MSSRPALIRLFLAGFVVLAAGGQLIRPAKNLSPDGPGPADLAGLHPPPAAVKAVLERACYDCHSNHTRYPWYADIQPVGWWLASHVKEGKSHLNFSTFGAYPAQRQLRKLDELIEEVEAGEMPLASYKLTHPDARLSPDEIRALTDWARAVRGRLPAP